MLTRWTDRRGTVTKYCMDEAGNVELIGYGYAGGGQPTCGSAFASTTAFTYDSASRLEALVDSVSGTITRTWDDLDRLTNETTPQGSLTFTYDDANRRQSLTVAGQPAIAYSYFSDDQLKDTTRGATVVSFAYDAANRLDTTTLPNGVVEDWSYDQTNRTTGVGWAKAGQASLGTLSYAMDASGRRTNVWGASSRLTLPAATTANAVYDAASQLTSWNGTTLGYDNNGNLTSHGTQTYTWNERNQLSATSAGSSSYAHDGLGRRYSKTVSGATTRYLYDGPNVVQELDGTNTPTFNLLTGFSPDQIFWRQGVSGANTVTNSLLHDGLGSTVATTTPAATPAVRDAFTYEPYGKPSSSAFPYLFTGRDHDATTGLQYNRARTYAPAYGRFTSEDPIGIVGGSANPYLYGGNAPTVFTDPSGLLLGGSDLSRFGLTFDLASLFSSGLGLYYTLGFVFGALNPAWFVTAALGVSLAASLLGTATAYGTDGFQISAGLTALGAASSLATLFVNPATAPVAFVLLTFITLGATSTQVIAIDLNS